MKYWNKTTMQWHLFQQKTDIPHLDWPNKNEPGTIAIESIEVVCLPNRHAELRLGLDTHCVKSPLSIAEFRERMICAIRKDEDVIAWVCDDAFRLTFTADFPLDRGEMFCQTAIEVVQRLFKQLGILDKFDFYAGSFTIHEQTFVRAKNEWITFADWLREKNHLPRTVNEDGHLA